MTDERADPPADPPADPAADPSGEPTSEPESEAPLPPDPEAYDSPRAVQARARGLAAPYIAGGTDPDPEPGRREERRYVRWLLVMIVVIVLSGFVLGYIAKALGFPT